MQRAYLVAELGSNHQGDLDLALQMIDAAASSGANAVKFQKRDLTTCYTAEYLARPYHSENAFGNTYGEHRRHLEFGYAEYRLLKRKAKQVGVEFGVTAFDEPSVDFLADLGVDFIKIASADIHTTPLLVHAVDSGIPLVVSTGTADKKAVEAAYGLLRGKGNEFSPNTKFAFLDCLATYPNDYEDLDLACITWMKQEFPDIKIGASLHTNGPGFGLVARVLGAEIIEMHFTLDRSMKGSDHAFSLEPQGLEWLVVNIRRFEKAYKDGDKKVHPKEMDALVKLGKSLVLAHWLPAETKLTRADLRWKTPGGGIPASHLNAIIGRKLAFDRDADHMLSEEDLVPEPGARPDQQADHLRGVVAS